ncbi:MAG: sel1 repeat family protein, partial [Elusimicrobiales bacterium]|nr:sel1 repeat family protein [Elusimicrobiales bacterium]
EATKKGFCLGAIYAADMYSEMKDWDKAEEYAKKASDMQNAASECIEMAAGVLALTEFYKTGVVENEYQKILANYAKKGSLISQTALGNLYHDAAEKKSKNSNKSSDINKLYKKAVYWYEKSIKQSPLNPDMSYTLAKIYSNDKVWTWHQKLFGRNYKKAFKYYLEAAKQYPEAQEILGKMYYEGKGVNQNYYKATEWLRKAADGNRKEAQYMLGEMYENAQGVYMNTEESVKWYKKAAEEKNTGESSEEKIVSTLTEVAPFDEEKKKKEQEHNAEIRAKSQFRLGLIYEEGRRDIKKDLSKAFEYYTLSSEYGYAPAQYNLGQMYEKGHGVSADKAEARSWYEKAAAQGNKEAQAALDKLAISNE